MRVSLQKTFDPATAASGRHVVAAAFLVLAAAMVGVTVLLYFIGRSVGGEAALLAATGTEAEAVVVARQIVETVSTDRDGHRNHDTDYYLTLEFTTAAGEVVKVERSVGQQRYREAPEGTALTVRYAPSDPRVLEFEVGERASEAKVLGWISWVTGGLAAVFAVLGLWKLRRQVPVT